MRQPCRSLQWRNRWLHRAIWLHFEWVDHRFYCQLYCWYWRFSAAWKIPRQAQMLQKDADLSRYFCHHDHFDNIFGTSLRFTQLDRCHHHNYWRRPHLVHIFGELPIRCRSNLPCERGARRKSNERCKQAANLCSYESDRTDHRWDPWTRQLYVRIYPLDFPSSNKFDSSIPCWGGPSKAEYEGCLKVNLCWGITSQEKDYVWKETILLRKQSYRRGWCFGWNVLNDRL